MRFRSQRGFTLVEMLVVVAIIALLATFAIPRTYNAWNSSRQAQVAHDLKTIQDALERHYTDLGYYPVKLYKLVDRGYVKGGFRFKSPIGNRYYFYAVDDNSSETSPRAYILGDPGKTPTGEAYLYQSGPLPAGRTATKSGEWARAWKTWTPNDRLTLHAQDGTVLNGLTIPDSLSSYRTGCRPGATVPCDVYTN